LQVPLIAHTTQETGDCRMEFPSFQLRYHASRCPKWRIELQGGHNTLMSQGSDMFLKRSRKSERDDDVRSTPCQPYPHCRLHPVCLLKGLGQLAGSCQRHPSGSGPIRGSSLRVRFLTNGASGIMDLNGIVQCASPSYESVLGVKPNDYIGQPGRSIIHPDDVSNVLLMMEKVKTHKESVLVEYSKVDRDGVSIDVETSLIPVMSDNGDVVQVIAVSRDSSERKRYERELHQMVYYDPLTQLPNRRLFTDRLDQAIAWSRRTQVGFSVMFLDCDNFKHLNDTYGHEFADQVLVEYANRLKNCVRQVDTVARFAGDEFVILLPTAGTHHCAQVVAERIAESLRQLYNINGHEIQTTSSIGIAQYPRRRGNRDVDSSCRSCNVPCEEFTKGRLFILLSMSPF